MNTLLYSLILGLFSAAGLYWSGVTIVNGIPPSAKKEYLFRYTLLSGIFLLIGMLVGARIAFCFTHWTIYSSNPWAILDFRSGGLSWIGLVPGGLISLLIYSGLRNGSLIDQMSILFHAIGLISIGIWLGAEAANIGYGHVITQLHNGFKVVDVVGDILPRVPLNWIGIILSFTFLAITDLLSRLPASMKTVYYCMLQFLMILIFTFFRDDPMVVINDHNIERATAFIYF